jgi:hypothetical protein
VINLKGRDQRDAWRRSCFCLWKHQCQQSSFAFLLCGICNQRPSFSHCRFKLLRDTGNEPNLLNRTLQWGMGNSLTYGHGKPKRQSATRLLPHCSLGMRMNKARLAGVLYPAIAL